MPLTGIVSNAGIALGGPLETLPLDELRRQYEVNVFGAPPVPGIGIASMRHRAQVIGARLTLENTRSDEVRLRVTINHEAAQTLREEGDRQ